MPKIKNKELMNNSEIYQDFFEERGVKKILHNSVPNINFNFNQEAHAYKKHIWRKGDTLIRLSNKYYQTFSYWHVIGFFNKKPIDTMYLLGEEIKIPINVTTILGLM